MTIESKRKKIDAINNQILDLLEQREQIAREIGKEKKRRYLPINDPQREEEILAGLKEKARQKGIPPEVIETIFRLIIARSRKVQEEVKGDE